MGANGKPFYVGDFDVLHCKSLADRLLDAELDAADDWYTLGGLTFRNSAGATRELILAESSAGAVFQVTSLFNCLESIPIGSGPMDGVRGYSKDCSQGATAALA